MLVRELPETNRVFDDVAEIMSRGKTLEEFAELLRAWDSMKLRRAINPDVLQIIKEGMSLTQHDSLDDFFTETIMYITSIVHTRRDIKCVLKLYSVFV